MVFSRAYDVVLCDLIESTIEEVALILKCNVSEIDAKAEISKLWELPGGASPLPRYYLHYMTKLISTDLVWIPEQLLPAYHAAVMGAGAEFIKSHAREIELLKAAEKEGSAKG